MTNNNTSVAIETLLYRNGLSEKDIADAFALFSGYDIDYADFYFQRSVSEGYVLEESIVKTGLFFISSIPITPPSPRIIMSGERI